MKKRKKIPNMQRRRKEQIPVSQKNMPESALDINDAQMAEYMAKAETAFAESGDQTRYFIHDPMGLHSQQEPDGTWRHMIRDGLNSIRGVTDDTLSILESREYDPFGNLVSTQGMTQTPFGFTGEMTDPNDLVHLRTRYYDPELGVFPSPDPVPGNIQEPMSLNQYMYAGNNPINNVDPSGECWHSINATNDERRACWQLWQERYPGVSVVQIPPQYGNFDPGCIRQQYFTLSQMDYLSFVQNWNSGNYQPCPGSPITTPMPTVTCTPALAVATSTPPPTNTPRPGIHLPMDSARLTPYGCNWVVSGDATTGLRSRDVNPPGYPEAGAVYAPVPQAEVWLVDDNGNNAGLGNFVVLRVDTRYLPPETQAALPGQGYLYIGYAHLSTLYVSEADIGNFVPQLQIGLSGQSGTDNIHLDLTVIFNSAARDSTQMRLTFNDDPYQRFFTLGLQETYWFYRILWCEEGIYSPCATKDEARSSGGTSRDNNVSSRFCPRRRAVSMTEMTLA